MAMLTDSIDPFGDGSLISKYQLNGDATDLTGVFNGTPNNVTYADGEFDQSAVGNGVDSYINLTGHTEFRTTEPFTVSMFVLTNDMDSEQRFWAYNVLTNSYVMLRIHDGTFSANACGGYITGATSVLSGVFHHIALTYDGTTAKLYVDGVYDGERSGEHSNITSDKNFYVLASRTPATFFAGKLDQLELYDRALTEAEVGNLFTQTISTFVSIVDSVDPFGDGSLVAKYQLNDDATDLTGNFNGTANNVTYDDGKFGQAGVFNGSNGYVTLGDGLFNTSVGFSFSLWVKTQSVVYSGVLRQGISGDNPLVSLSNNSATVWDFSIEFSDGDQYGVTIDANLVNDNIWHNISASVDFEARLLKVYVDGTEVGSVNLLNGSFISMDSPIYVGGMGDQLYCFDGKIDQVEIYNRALTQEEVSNLFTQTVGAQQDPILHLLLNLSAITWSNRETKEQANPQPIYLENHGIVPFDSTYAVKNNPFYADPIVDQNSKLREFGYIASTTQVGGVPIGNKRVMLFAHDNGMLLDETVSDNQGNYRFDSLLMGKKYMITAQYGNANEHTPPDYNATSTDWQSPTAYEV